MAHNTWKKQERTEKKELKYNKNKGDKKRALENRVKHFILLSSFPLTSIETH